LGSKKNVFQFNNKEANVFKYELKYQNGMVTLSPKEGASAAQTYQPHSRLGEFMNETKSQHSNRKQERMSNRRTTNKSNRYTGPEEEKDNTFH
jgi:hypothetical protein